MIKLSLILFTSALFTSINQDVQKEEKFSYKLKATSGGPNGFNSVNSSCNPYTNKFNLEFSGEGYEKFEFLCFKNLPDPAKEIIISIKPLILEGKDTIGQMTIKEYTGKFSISDKFNFEVDIFNQ